MKIQISFEDDNGDAVFFVEKEDPVDIDLLHPVWSRAIELLDVAQKHMRELFNNELNTSWNEYNDRESMEK